MRRLAITVTALALIVSACAGGDDPQIEGSDLGAEVQDDGEGDADADAGQDSDPAGDEPADGLDEGTDEDEDIEGSGTTEDDGAPSPDEAALEDPCADHVDRDGEAFIALVAPIDDQQVAEGLDLVGCASVYEGTIQYRLLDGDGATLDEGFFTAECGGPCIGEFRETLVLEGMGEEPVLYVQVYWEDPADGSERDLEERIVVLG